MNRPAMKRMSSLLFVALFAFLGGSATVFLSPRLLSPALADGQTPASSSSEVAKLSERFEAIAKKISPCVVAVEAVKPSAPSTNGKAKPVEESGSGVLFRVGGQKGILVLTNNHVIAQAP